MLLRQALLEEEEHQAQRNIAKLQRERDSWAITDQDYEDKYEAIMDSLRLRFAILMDWRALEAYNTYHESLPPTPRGV